MTTPEDPSDREIFLAQLGTSDEDVESLMSGGADVDDLIAAGVLDDTESAPQEVDGEEAFVIEPSTLTEEEALAWFARQQEWLVANGHDYRPVQI